MTYIPYEKRMAKKIAKSNHDNSSKVENLTDTTNAERIVAMFGEKVRFDHKRRRWLIYEDHRWKTDEVGRITEYAIEAIRKLQKDAVEIEDKGEKKRVLNWAIQSEGKGRLDNAVGIVKILSPIADSGKDWDQDPMLLCCTNGVVDLRTGKLRPGKPEDRITMATGTAYDMSAKCPRWIQFLHEIFGDQELIDYVHKALGYSISGSTQEQVVFFGFGAGSNGKTTLFSAIRAALGDYAHNAPTSLFQRSTQPAPSNDLAGIEYKRFLISSETLSSAKLNEQRIKTLSGNDPITARFLYSENFTFTPVCKIWLFINHKPQVEDDTYSFWRRVRLIPFNNTFKKEAADTRLAETLKSELPGILAWLVKGCLLWQKEGLSPTPSIVENATKNYQIENDVLAEFIYEACLEGADLEVKASELYGAYLDWAQSKKMKDKEVLTRNAFGRRMTDKYRKDVRKDAAYYLGICIKGGGFNTPSRHEVVDSNPFSIKSPMRENSIYFMENDHQSTTQAQNSTTNPPPDIDIQFDSEGNIIL